MKFLIAGDLQIEIKVQLTPVFFLFGWGFLQGGFCCFLTTDYAKFQAGSKSQGTAWRSTADCVQTLLVSMET